MAFTQYGLDVLSHLCIVQRIVDIVTLAGSAVRQGNLQVELQCLGDALLAFIDADEGDDFEFADEDDVHIEAVSAVWW